MMLGQTGVSEPCGKLLQMFEKQPKRACHQGWALTLDPDTTDRSRADFVRYRRFAFQAVNGIRCHDYLDNVVLGARLACMTMDKPPTPPV